MVTMVAVRKTYIAAWLQERMENSSSIVINQESVYRSPLLIDNEILDLLQGTVNTGHTKKPSKKESAKNEIINQQSLDRWA